MNAARQYRMSARAESVALTRRRILQALFDLTWEEATVEITLDRVAKRAGVSVRTVLRRFGDRESLFDALRAFAHEAMTTEREIALSGPPEQRIHHLVGQYELRGDALVRFLAQEIWDARLRHGIERGRQGHRQWVQQAFAAELPADQVVRDARVDQLVVVTDVYAWKLLRRDRGLSRDATEARMLAMVLALLTHGGE